MRPREKSPARHPVFVFDFGGVVIKWRNNDPIFDYIAERYGIPIPEMRRAFELALARLETGDVSTRDFLEDVLGEFGKRLRKGDSPEELWTLPFERLVKFRVGTVALVRSLRRRGYSVYLFSNTSMPHARLLRRKGWDKLFDGFLASCELRSMKPSATAFGRALDSFGAKPSDVVFIDDKEANVKGAKDFGIRRAFRFTSVERLRRDIAAVMGSSR
ncbi:MAG TPA: HAD family phosphatase [Nitrososphaerales archaeon]|nr:HAD family phosphatase [Nitrososphaerales archaeon]